MTKGVIHRGGKKDAVGEKGGINRETRRRRGGQELRDRITYAVIERGGAALRGLEHVLVDLLREAVVLNDVVVVVPVARAG